MKRLALASHFLFLLFAALPSASLAESLVPASTPVQKPGCNNGVADNGAARPDDSLWMVRSRCLCCSCGDKQKNPEFRFWRHEGNCGWQETDWSDWTAAEPPGTVTVIYVHGNRVEEGDAAGRGWAAYRALVREAADSGPIRFVIWAWPSAKLPGLRPKRDVQVKAARTPCQSYRLAHFLTQLNPDTQLGLWGYSFGARIISGALHLTEGGALGCLQSDGSDARPAHSVRVAMLAAAMDNDWWLPGHHHERAWSAVDRLCLLYNTCDPVLRFYPRLDRRCPAQALGYTGFDWPASLGDDAWRLEQADVCCEIGKTHDEHAYLASDAVMRRVSETLLAP